MEKELLELDEYFCEKAHLKQEVYAVTLEAFGKVKSQAKATIDAFKEERQEKGYKLDLEFNESGAFEAEMRFSGDALVFEMHSNVFAFPKEHFLNQKDAVKTDPSSGYVGMILIYNFLADSLRYNRLADIGYLLGRIFVNKNGQYFMDGNRQFSFLFSDFDNQVFDDEAAMKIVQTSVKHSVDFDLFVPRFDQVKEITLHQKVIQQGSAPVKTGKRLGFAYDGRDD